MAPSTPPPPSSDELAAFTIAVVGSCVMSPITTTTRPSKKNSGILLVFTTRFGVDFVKHVLTTKCFGNAFGGVFVQRMIRIRARDLKHAVVQHHDTERAECNAGRHEDLVHVMDAKAAGLFDPIFEKGVA